MTDDPGPGSDPARPIPTVVWMAMGVLLILAFVAAVVVLGQGKAKSVGPSAGAAANQPASLAH